MSDDDVGADVSARAQPHTVTNPDTVLEIGTRANDGTGADLGTHAERDLPAELDTIVDPRIHTQSGKVVDDDVTIEA